MTPKEVKKGESIIKLYWNDLLRYNDLTDEKEYFEIRDYINDPDYCEVQELVKFNKDEVQYYFSCVGLYIKLISCSDHVSYSCCGDINVSDTFLNLELTTLENIEIIMYMLIEKLKKYSDYCNYTPNRWEILKERNFKIAMTINQ